MKRGVLLEGRAGVLRVNRGVIALTENGGCQPKRLVNVWPSHAPLRLGFYRILLVSNENWVGKAMLALRPKGSKSYPESSSCVIDG